MSARAVTAQSNLTTTVVKVTDLSGAVIANAEVILVPLIGSSASSMITDANGIAYVAAREGRCELTVSARGFKTWRQTVEIGSTPSTMSVKLQVGGGSSMHVEMPAPVKLEPLTAILDDAISPSRPISTGLAPGMQVKVVKKSKDETVYAVIFHKGDEALSGLTDFATQNHLVDAHFTGIGAVSSAVVGWLNLPEKQYQAIRVPEQVEVLSMIGDIATFNGKAVVHSHVVLGRRDGSTVGGHVWELHVNPTLEVFVTANTVPLKKRPDEESGMKMIDPTQ